MNVLAFDTCLGAVSVAAGCRDAAGTWAVTETFELRTSGHAERLMPMIGDTLRDAGLAYADVDRIAVTVGPGSFTGVRVGVAAARALALATGKPVVCMTSLAVMAAGARRELDERRPLAIAVESRAGMIYFARFDEGGSDGTPLLLEPAAAAARIGNRPTVVVGSAAAAVARECASLGGVCEIALPHLQPRARWLAEKAPDLSPAVVVRPLYLRPPDARNQDDKSLPRVAP
jgi:tRNA threonylcarbamoyladenosine biosynthesis protein TsaB